MFTPKHAGMVLAALALLTCARTLQAQAATGGMAIRVTVVESIGPIAVTQAAEAVRVVTDARGVRGQIRFGIESDMPVDVSIRAADGSPIANTTLATRIRLVGATPVARGSAAQGRGFAAGANEVGIDFDWSDFGDAAHGTLELPATEVRATARKGDAEVTVIAYLPARSVEVPRTTAVVAAVPAVASAVRRVAGAPRNSANGPGHD